MKRKIPTRVYTAEASSSRRKTEGEALVPDPPPGEAERAMAEATVKAGDEVARWEDDGGSHE